MGHLNSRSAFSLIEILISITLLSFLTIGIMSLITTAGNKYMMLTKLYKAKSKPLDVFALFDWDFSQIYSPLYIEFWLDTGKTYSSGKDEKKSSSLIENKVQMTLLQDSKNLRSNLKNFIRRTISGYIVPNIFGVENSKIIFFTESHRPRGLKDKQSFFQWVYYECKENKIIRKTIVDNVYTQNSLDFENTKEQILLEGIEKCEISFWHIREKKFLKAENLVPPNAFVLRAIKLSLMYENNLYEKIFMPIWDKLAEEQEKNL